MESGIADMNISRQVSLFATSPACIAGVPTSEPNLTRTDMMRRAHITIDRALKKA